MTPRQATRADASSSGLQVDLGDGDTGPNLRSGRERPPELELSQLSPGYGADQGVRGIEDADPSAGETDVTDAGKPDVGGQSESA